MVEFDCSKCGRSTFLDGYVSTSGIIETQCPHPQCSTKVWLCPNCGKNLHKKSKQCITRRRSAKTLMGMHKCQSFICPNFSILNDKKRKYSALNSSTFNHQIDSNGDAFQPEQDNNDTEVELPSDDNSDETCDSDDDELLISTAMKSLSLICKKEDSPVEKIVNLQLEHDNNYGQQNEVQLDAMDDINSTATKTWNFKDFDIFDYRSQEKRQNGFGREMVSQNQLFFYHQCLEKGGFGFDIGAKGKNTGGFQGIVSRIGDREASLSVNTTYNDSKVSFRLLKMVMNQSNSQQIEFMDFVTSLKETSNNCAFNSYLPQDINELRRKITKGPNSMYKLIPSPQRQPIGQIHNHAVFSLKETLLLHAGHGAEYDFAWNGGSRAMNWLNGTDAMTDLIEDVKKCMKESGVIDAVIVKTKIGWLLFWSDSFLRCFIKQKDNSVWMLTVTVCPPESQKTSDLYTYVLAIGNSSSDHAPIIEHFLKEANELKKGFECYFGCSNTMERVAFGMICYNADRPENQSTNNTRQEGKFGRVLGWSVNPRAHFPSCIECFKSLVSNMLDGNNNEDNLNKCGDCCNFTLKHSCSEDETRHFGDSTSKDYPKTYPAGYGTMPPGREAGLEFLKPVKLSSKWLLKAVSAAYYGVAAGGWKSATFKEFIRCCNIRGDLGDLVYAQAMADKGSDSLDHTIIEPQMWKIINMFERHRAPCVPMHGLFHGMIPDCMYALHGVFTSYRQLSNFYEFANPMLDAISGLRLDWCKTKSLPKAAGLSRVFSYLYGMYLKKTPLGSTKTNKCGPEKAQETVMHIKCMLNSFQAFLSTVMSTRKSDKNMILNIMKIFFCSTHYLQRKHGSFGVRDEFLSNLDFESIKLIATKIGVEVVGNPKKTTVIKNILKVNTNKIKRHLTKDQKRKQGLTVSKMIQMIYENEMDANCQVQRPTTNDDEDDFSSEKQLWAGGNWLSFLANVPDQIEYLGPLLYIW